MTAQWRRVRLELARSHEFPEGSTRHGYVLVLPLDERGRIDEAIVRKTPELCTLHRFWEGEGDSVGQVVRRGSGRWAFAYHADRADDEPVPHLPDHVFRPGEYLGVREANRTEHTLRVVAVDPAPGLAHAEPSRQGRGAAS
ncbi:MAG TPA: hypothetical protein VLV50_18945 [Stellaceae bacterium]|nr:hypothetical protein [Stellaceae bacterium]